jgi:hypothetical protein
MEKCGPGNGAAFFMMTVLGSFPSSCHVGIVPSHPSRKNKDAARVGHPHGLERDK